MGAGEAVGGTARQGRAGHSEPFLVLGQAAFLYPAWDSVDSFGKDWKHKAERTELSGSAPCPSHKFSHSIRLP